LAGYWDNLGQDFWFGVPYVNTVTAGTNEPVSVQIIAPEGASGTLVFPSLGLSQNFNLGSYGWASLVIPQAALQDMMTLGTGPSIQDSAGHITSDRPVSVQLAILPGWDDALVTLHPTGVQGTAYDYLSYGTWHNPTGAVVATQDNTLLQIIPSITAAGFSAGVTVTASINQGQWYDFYENAPMAIYDYTGTQFIANKPVLVLAGNSGCSVPASSSAPDFLLDEAPPSADWGSTFVAVTFAVRTGGDFLRIMARDDSTQVFMNGVLQGNLNSTAFFDATITAHTMITANRPVLVEHLMASFTFDNTNGDPSMDYLQPVDQWSTGALFVAMQSQGPYTQWFVNIAVPAGGEGGVTLDGASISASSFSPAGSGFSAAQVPIGLGLHRVASSMPCQVEQYAMCPYGSYATIAGRDLPLSTATLSPTLTPSSTTTPSASRTCTASVTPSMTPSITQTLTITATPTPRPLPLLLHLYPSSPNPFGNQGTYITYWLQVDALIDIRIYDISGELVRDLNPVEGKAGDNEAFWDGKNNSGRLVASGVFIYLVSAVTPRNEHVSDFGKCAAVR
jgi:hypothetical protein